MIKNFEDYEDDEDYQDDEDYEDNEYGDDDEVDEDQDEDEVDLNYYQDGKDINYSYVMYPRFDVPFNGAYHDYIKWNSDKDGENKGLLITEKWNDGKVDHLQSINCLGIFSNSDSWGWRHYDAGEYPISFEDGIFVGEIKAPDMNYCVLGFDETDVNVATILGKVLTYDEMVVLTQKGNKSPKLWDNLYKALVKHDQEQLSKLTGLSVEIFKPLIDKAWKSEEEWKEKIAKEKQEQLG